MFVPFCHHKKGLEGAGWEMMGQDGHVLYARQCRLLNGHELRKWRKRFTGGTGGIKQEDEAAFISQLLAPSLLIILACLLSVRAVITGACKSLQAWSTGSHSILIFSGRDNSYMHIYFYGPMIRSSSCSSQVGFVIKVLTDL